MPVKILDLFCGAGGAARGLYIPGAVIYGVDNRPQPHYPYTLIRGDAMTFPLDGFDIIHASPPCEGHTPLRNWEHPDTSFMLWQTIERLRVSTAKLWMVENVRGVSYPPDEQFTLCGTSLGCITRDGSRYYLARHRKFWCSLELQPPPCQCMWYRNHGWQCAGVYGGGNSSAQRFRGIRPQEHHKRLLMGIDWMTRAEMNQAVPPTYTRWILNQAMARGVLA